MTTQEAITELNQIRNVYANMRKEYKSCVEAIEMAIEALERQIPMSNMEEWDISGRRIKVCGNCEEVPGNGDFCKWCGQRIKR